MVFGNAVILGTTLLLFCFHFPAQLLGTSAKVLGWLSKQQRFGGDDTLLMRKKLKSLKPVRIKFMHSNYFGKLTPFNFFVFFSKVAIKMTLIGR